MHRLHYATVLSAAADSDFESDERLAMLFEGSLGGSRSDGHGGLTAPILFDTGASSNFVSPRLLKQAAISSSSSATLRLADDSSAPILGKVRLRLKLHRMLLVLVMLISNPLLLLQYLARGELNPQLLVCALISEISVLNTLTSQPRTPR